MTQRSQVVRSIAEQSPAELGGALSVLRRQRSDHVQLGEYLNSLGSTPESEQGPLLQSIYRLVFPHAFAEEAVLWPVIRRVLPDGHELTLRVEREHQAINELVQQLEDLPPGSSDRQAVLGRTIELLIEDVRDEEDLLLPRLQAALTPLQLRLLGIAWEAVRRIAPTRPHPVVSRRPPGNVLSALPLTVLDRVRDRVEAAGFPHSSNTVRRSTAGLKVLAQAVERLPGMRAGEDPDTRVSAHVPDRRVAWLGAGLAASTALIVLWHRRAQAGMEGG
jgi:hypothetical protein